MSGRDAFGTGPRAPPPQRIERSFAPSSHLQRPGDPGCSDEHASSQTGASFHQIFGQATQQGYAATGFSFPQNLGEATQQGHAATGFSSAPMFGQVPPQSNAIPSNATSTSYKPQAQGLQVSPKPQSLESLEEEALALYRRWKGEFAQLLGEYRASERKWKEDIARLRSTKEQLRDRNLQLEKDLAVATSRNKHLESELRRWRVEFDQKIENDIAGIMTEIDALASRQDIVAATNREIHGTGAEQDSQVYGVVQALSTTESPPIVPTAESEDQDLMMPLGLQSPNLQIETFDKDDANSSTEEHEPLVFVDSLAGSREAFPSTLQAGFESLDRGSREASTRIASRRQPSPAMATLSVMPRGTPEKALRQSAPQQIAETSRQTPGLASNAGPMVVLGSPVLLDFHEEARADMGESRPATRQQRSEELVKRAASFQARRSPSKRLRMADPPAQLTVSGYGSANTGPPPQIEPSATSAAVSAPVSASMKLDPAVCIARARELTSVMHFNWELSDAETAIFEAQLSALFSKGRTVAELAVKLDYHAVGSYSKAPPYPRACLFGALGGGPSGSGGNMSTRTCPHCRGSKTKLCVWAVLADGVAEPYGPRDALTQKLASKTHDPAAAPGVVPINGRSVRWIVHKRRDPVPRVPKAAPV